MTKKILGVALAVLMLLVVAFPVNAATEASKVDMRGNVATGNGSQTWDAQTFAGFYYDIKYDRSTENLKVIAVDGTTIQKDNLWYNTTTALVDFKVFEKENVTVDGDQNYALVGWQAEKWIGVKGIANKIAKLAFEMSKDDKKTLTTGETWSLGAGYELNINAIDARTTPRQVWFTLKKDGAIIDEGIGQAPAGSTDADQQKAVYYKKKTILGESDALLFTVYVDTIFSGATSDMVQFKYAWLIDETSAKEIKNNDKYGVFEVRTSNADDIKLGNENTVSLSKNTETTLMGNLKMRTADNDTLRYYPYVEYTAPGTYELRGNVVNANGSQTWDAQSFAGFYYDIKYNRSTETLKVIAVDGTTIQKDNLWYNTTTALVDYKVFEKENVTVDGDQNYALVGWQAERWIGVKNIANKIAKLAFEMSKDDKKTLTTGETWSLGAGYELNINAIDARTTPRQVWFTLKKDGAIIDEGIGQAPAGSTDADQQKAVYYKKKTILGESDALLFTVYVDTIFSGATSDMVQFKYAWLIDETSAKEIKNNDKYGVFEVRTSNADDIKLGNENTVSLSKNTETTLMGEIKFKTADNDTLRYYPKVDYVIGGTGEGNVTATVTGATPTGTATTNVTANVTATTPVMTTEGTPVTTTPATTTPVTTTVPGFEAMFAIAGLLAVAYIVLRQRK